MTTPTEARRGAESARPGAGEFSPYYDRYISRIPDGDIRRYLEEQGKRLGDAFTSIPEPRGDHRYAPEKWSVREVLSHINDTERVMSYRALRIGRGDRTPLAGFDENSYVPQSNAAARTIADLVAEFRAVRSATVLLFDSFPADAWLREGLVNEAAMSVRGLAWIIAGHAEHHAELLRDRYLV